MGLLPSGLPELVANDEKLARVLTQSNHFNAKMAKAAAFVPSADGTKSVARHTGLPPEELWQIARGYLGPEATIYGAAICITSDVRVLELDVLAAEPPPRHANIVGWPVNSDPELQKAKRKELALAIASCCHLLLRTG